MKTNKSILYLLAAVFFFSLTSYVVAKEEITKEYLVKINGIEMTSSSAQNLLVHIAGLSEDKTTQVINMDTGGSVDITKPIVVSEGTNIEINNNLVKEILNLFNICSSKNSIPGYRIIEYANITCILKEQEEYKGTYLCINHSNQITTIAFF